MGRSELGLWAGMGVKEVLAVATVLSGMVAAFSSVQVQVQSCTARVAVLERSSVPRSEHAVQDAEREKREREWDARLDRIEGKLDRVLERRR